MGGHHWWALDTLRRAGLVDAQVTMAYDRDPQAAARFHAETGTPLAASLETLVADSDVVWVTTWTAGHLEPVLAATAAGKAVFVEKPLAPSLAECERLALALRDVPHQVGLILRHAPAYVFVAEQVASGRYGRPMGALFRDDQKFPLGAATARRGAVTWSAPAAAPCSSTRSTTSTCSPGCWGHRRRCLPRPRSSRASPASRTWRWSG